MGLAGSLGSRVVHHSGHRRPPPAHAAAALYGGCATSSPRACKRRPYAAFASPSEGGHERPAVCALCALCRHYWASRWAALLACPKLARGPRGSQPRNLPTSSPRGRNSLPGMGALRSRRMDASRQSEDPHLSHAWAGKRLLSTVVWCLHAPHRKARRFTTTLEMVWSHAVHSGSSRVER